MIAMQIICVDHKCTTNKLVWENESCAVHSPKRELQECCGPIIISQMIWSNGGIILHKGKTMLSPINPEFEQEKELWVSLLSCIIPDDRLLPLLSMEFFMCPNNIIPCIIILQTLVRNSSSMIYMNLLIIKYQSRNTVISLTMKVSSSPSFSAWKPVKWVLRNILSWRAKWENNGLFNCSLWKWKSDSMTGCEAPRVTESGDFLGPVHLLALPSPSSLAMSWAMRLRAKMCCSCFAN